MRTVRLLWLCTVAMSIAACGPTRQAAAEKSEGVSATAVASEASVPAPPDPEGLFKACTWGKIGAATLSIWSWSCPTAHLVADPTLPGFMLEESRAQRLAVRIFKKRADEPIAAILPAVRAASPGPHSDGCELMARTSDATHFEFGPTGAAAAEWTAAQNNGGKTAPPCGPLGPDFVGDRTFWVMPHDPTTVVYADMGSEIQIFDPTTLRLQP